MKIMEVIRNGKEKNGEEQIVGTDFVIFLNIDPDDSDSISGRFGK